MYLGHSDNGRGATEEQAFNVLDGETTVSLADIIEGLDECLFESFDVSNRILVCRGRFDVLACSEGRAISMR